MSTVLENLPRERWFGVMDIHKWEGFWYVLPHLRAAIAAQSHFKASADDVILASSMKTGTTWLKALIPCIMNYNRDDDKDPLTKNHPNVLMPSLEVQLYKGHSSPNLSDITSPRLFRTHLPYKLLPESIKKTDCKIVYITRNPKDTFVSMWHFANCVLPPLSFKDAFDGFCKGIHAFGPFFDHVLEYWKESSKNPEKILFMRFEEMKSDPKGQVKRLATFLGRPLENDEDVEKVLWRCSLERLKNLEVNKSGVDPWVGAPNSSYFRKGMVGGWKDSLTDEMSERLDEIARVRLEGSGLKF